MKAKLLENWCLKDNFLLQNRSLYSNQEWGQNFWQIVFPMQFFSFSIPLSWMKRSTSYSCPLDLLRVHWRFYLWPSIKLVHELSIILKLCVNYSCIIYPRSIACLSRNFDLTKCGLFCSHFLPFFSFILIVDSNNRFPRRFPDWFRGSEKKKKN